MTNKEVAHLLKETSALIELTGGNTFRARAFSGAARRIDRMEEPIKQLHESGQIMEIDGIGKGLAGQVGEILQRGSFEVRDELLDSIPPGLTRVLRVKGLGAKKVRALWTGLGVESLDDLEEMAATGRIAELDGFGKKTQDAIIENVANLKTYLGKVHFSDADALAEAFEARLKEALDADVYRTGLIRRTDNVVDTLEFVSAVADPDAVDAPAGLGRTDVTDGRTLFAGETTDGLRIRLTLTSPDEAGSTLFETTGPQSFVDAWSEQHGPVSAAMDERDIFERAGVPYILPELRDLPDALERADEIASLDLITLDDLRGNLHNHSTYSDGADTLRAMSEACRSRGYDYFGICDHSQSLRIANGMTPDTVRRQREEVDALNAEYKSEGVDFRILFGVESDILPDGSLDYDEETLELFDIIVASVHQGFNMTVDEATNRIVSAITNPYTTILGHPTGRLLLRREGYEIDHRRVLEACAEYGVAIELNANPWRLDLDWTWVPTAVELGVPVSINPDAHSTDQLDLTRWGVAAARKGGLTADTCLNARSLPEFRDWLETRRP